MIEFPFIKSNSMTDSLFCQVLKAIIESEDHYRNYDKCRRLSMIWPRCRSVYRRAALVHKAMALIAYDRAMTARSAEFAKLVDKS